MIGEGSATRDGILAATVTTASCALMAMAVGGGLRRYSLS
jgi:hypothetical protein